MTLRRHDSVAGRQVIETPGSIGGASGTSPEPHLSGIDRRRESIVVRLSVSWFALAFASLATSLPLFALVFAVTSGTAALQLSRAWRRLGFPVQETAAVVVAACMPILGLAGPTVVGVGFLAVGVVALLFWRGGPGRPVDVDRTLGACLPPALAACSPVLLARVETALAISFLVLVSVYDALDYWIGTRSRRYFAGPAAGVVAVAVLSLPLLVMNPTPLGEGLVWYVVAVAVGAPVGQVLASTLVPDAKAIVSGLRRLDTYLLTGPLWVGMLWSGVGSTTVR
ncbi:MAG: hypothetical protein KatS3mg008_1213 [Acidimicrobiales bacterium]|nr:MAG: hypothetical protein KatS3mg008_1213 [Acidimicrobiales bacterium]